MIGWSWQAGWIATGSFGAGMFLITHASTARLSKNALLFALVFFFTILLAYMYADFPRAAASVVERSLSILHFICLFAGLRVSVVLQSLQVYFFGPNTCWHEDVTASLIAFYFSSTVSSSMSFSNAWNLLFSAILNSFCFVLSFRSVVLYTFRWFTDCADALLNFRFIRKTKRW